MEASCGLESSTRRWNAKIDRAIRGLDRQSHPRAAHRVAAIQATLQLQEPIRLPSSDASCSPLLRGFPKISLYSTPNPTFSLVPSPILSSKSEYGIQMGVDVGYKMPQVRAISSTISLFRPFFSLRV